MPKGIRDSRLRGNDNKRLLRRPSTSSGLLAMTMRKPPRNDNKAVNF